MKCLVLGLSLIMFVGCKALPVKENIFYKSKAEYHMEKIDNLERGLINTAIRYSK